MVGANKNLWVGCTPLKIQWEAVNFGASFGIQADFHLKARSQRDTKTLVASFHGNNSGYELKLLGDQGT